MPKYKISVSKNQKKYSIILNADSDILVRKKVHKEGYSILGVEEINEDKIEGHKFIFEAVDKNGNNKKGKVVAKDPFKVYVKLREGLGYKVKFLYSEQNKEKSEGEKLDILRHLEEQYILYNSQKGKKIEKKEIEKENSKDSLDNFYIKKELNETYRLIDFVLIKLNNVLKNADSNDISTEKKEKLKKLYNSIIKVKKTTNINKLKQVGELALKKVGEIELSILEKNKDGNSKKFLNETNSLLKRIGSKEHFIEKEKDINYIFSKMINSLKETFSLGKREKRNKKQKIDKESTSYWKTILLIEKYTEKKKENNIEILKNIFSLFSKEKREKISDLFLKSKVIKQNITILKAKQTGKIVSYTKIIKGYNSFIELLLLLLKIINTYIIWFIYLFGIVIGIFFILVKLELFDINFNINGIFVLIYVLFGSFLIFLSRGVITLSINFAIFIFMVILGVVNF